MLIFQVAEQISSIHELEAENEKLKQALPLDNSSLADAESTVLALRTKLEQLQGSLSGLEQLQVENEMLKSEVRIALLSLQSFKAVKHSIQP